ncbi:MAG: pyruvate kinase [Acidobacteriaceae bacterium]|nr:pyruvate kinase [Acidobacteriaceae bacterium]MBV9498090.1 pyruvate kinase [Acidobacteriaceae bacterium]
MRATKIVATLGPSTDSPVVLQRLFEAGVDVFRLNASHGTPEQHANRIAAVRRLAAECNVHAGILLDLQGPKIRLGTFRNGSCVLEEGSKFTITTEPVEGTREIASTSFPEFAQDVKAGDPVLLADGSVELRVLEADGIAAKCVVINGGPISDRKGINLPGVKISTPSLSKKDIADARFGVEQGVDFFALSFVRQARDILRLRHLLEGHDARQPIIAKIEKPEAWQNLDSILDECEGLMVARGDLGVEMAIERVPAIQKAIIEKSRARGKFVITATQMLESMIEHSTPTRAEVSDIANAIYDGTSAVMLSAETSTGKHPVEAVKVMARISCEAEASINKKGFGDPGEKEDRTIPEIIADAAYHSARSAGVVALAVGTTSGSSARMLARYRPPVPIYAFTSGEIVARQLSVIYGVHPVILPTMQSTDEMLHNMERLLIETGRVKAGDHIVFVAGQPVGLLGSTNMLKLHRVSEVRP